MALLKNEEARELQVLRELEKQLVRKEKRERIQHYLICALALFSVAAFFAGHYTKR
ncbi:MAG: hypothetical protein K2J65_05640 [Duncaniella sp.]|nr:hypothetical protein [Duncaniella sp.]MDE6116776.1 hypothetical protein [Duncaniella sp.]MDE6859875.1 hypothetical protein [Duncaniella sp.]MDE7145941.1 hypothetical protein [Duncaniella sp.]